MRQAFPAHAKCGVAALARCDGSLFRILTERLYYSLRPRSRYYHEDHSIRDTTPRERRHCPCICNGPTAILTSNSVVDGLSGDANLYLLSVPVCRSCLRLIRNKLNLNLTGTEGRSHVSCMQCIGGCCTNQRPSTKHSLTYSLQPNNAPRTAQTHLTQTHRTAAYIW